MNFEISHILLGFTQNLRNADNLNLISLVVLSYSSPKIYRRYNEMLRLFLGEGGGRGGEDTNE